VAPSLWSWAITLEFAVGAGAGATKKVTNEPRKAFVVFGDLNEIAPPRTNPAPVTDRATTGDATGGHDVRAMLVGGEAPALAAVALGTGADADLVQAVRRGAGGDEVLAAALVAGEDLAGVELEESEAAQDVGGFGDGWVRHLRYTGVDQE
jgi:hypothetical protein